MVITPVQCCDIFRRSQTTLLVTVSVSSSWTIYSFTSFIISSFHWNELMQSRGVRRPSVCLPSVNFYTQLATSTTNMTRSPPNLHTIVPIIRARIQNVLKVNVKLKGHVIRTLLWCHEMFALQYLLTVMHSLYESTVTLSFQYKCTLSTSWNELLRHWRSGSV